jgi:hypothetical protein
MDEPLDGTLVFLEILPDVLRSAGFAFRAEREPHRRDERIQEVLALCWLWCCRLARQGKDARQFSTTLAVFAARQVRSGRSFVGKKTYRNDALSHHAQAVRGFLTTHLSAAGEEGAAWLPALQENTVSSVPDQVAFRLDFPAWLAALPRRHRQMAEEMATGETTLVLAARYALSPGRVSQLRREFHASWLAFTGEVA